MVGLSKRCPDDTTLEMLIYEDLPFLQKTGLRLHLALCPTCRRRFDALRVFLRELSRVPPVEPPEGFLEDLVGAMDTWGDPTPVSTDDQAGYIREPVLKVRWALAAALVVVLSILQWRYNDYLPPYLSGNLVSVLKGIGSLWESVRSGALWQGIAQVVAAVRTDGLSALEILGTTLPAQIAGVVVFGGIVTAVFISQLKAARRKGEDQE